MRERVAENTVNTMTFKEDIEFTADTPHSIRIKHFPLDELVPFHYADTLEILVADGVDGYISIGKNSRKFAEHDVVIIPPYYVHSTKCKKSGGVLYNFKISFKNLKEFVNIENIAAWSGKRLFGVIFAPELYDAMLGLMRRLIEQDGNIFARMHCILDIAELLAGLNDGAETRCPSSGTGDNDLLRSLIQWTHEHYAENITLELAASKMNISRFYLCKFFKQATNMTYVTYLNQVRVDEAAHMLLTGKNVTECAMECGFESVSYFIKLFKQTLGSTPGQYVRING